MSMCNKAEEYLCVPPRFNFVTDAAWFMLNNNVDWILISRQSTFVLVVKQNLSEYIRDNC